jgi:peptidoglycan/xylan/chitin deacetylase (PgdA/CDA1 family)
VTHGPRDRPRLALTFHGQGDPALVRRLLAELSNGSARVTVLAVGSWLESEPEVVRSILDGGHEIGNHTQNHLAIADLPPAQAYSEINECALRLKRLTGSIGAWFRPSQTQYATAAIRELAARAGYPTCLSYDVDSRDYTDPPATAVVRTTLSAAGPGSIVSLHFGHPATVTAMPEILDGLGRRGLSPVTVTELLH